MRALRGITSFSRAAGFAAFILAATGAAAAPVMPSATDTAGRWTDGLGYVNGRVLANGTSLHYIDYGGAGPAMVFLAGLGNSAHVFDEFAPRFTDAFHVLALTRRGYGESGQPKSGYDTASLGADVVTMLDSLGIARAVLVGHSVAGDELTAIAASAPGRVSALVYLDAAYDRSKTTRRLLGMAILQQLPPAPPRPNGNDRRSLESAREYLARIYGVRWPASEIAATRVFDEHGRWRRDATPAGTNLKVVRGECAPDLAHVRAPVLSIYSVRRTEQREFPWVQHVFVGRGMAHLKANRYRAAEERWEVAQRRRFIQAVPHARVLELEDASHYVFLSHGGRVESEIREFLRGKELTL